MHIRPGYGGFNETFVFFHKVSKSNFRQKMAKNEVSMKSFTKFHKFHKVSRNMKISTKKNLKAAFINLVKSNILHQKKINSTFQTVHQQSVPTTTLDGGVVLSGTEQKYGGR